MYSRALEIQISLQEAFWYDNLLPINELMQELSSALVDLDWTDQLLRKKSQRGFSIKHERRLGRLLAKKPTTQLSLLIKKFAEQADKWTQERCWSKAQSFAEAEFQCKQILKKFEAEHPNQSDETELKRHRQKIQ